MLTDRQFLPVTGIMSNDVGNNKTGYFSLGPMKCVGDTSEFDGLFLSFIIFLGGGEGTEYHNLSLKGEMIDSCMKGICQEP